MKLIKVSESLLQKYADDPEVMAKNQRPYVLVVRLKYKGKSQDFAVPLRSNIPAASPKNQYFPLPPRPSTRPCNRHGLHYIKMFPIDKRYFLLYRTEGNSFAQLIESIITKNSKTIVRECQSYLTAYEQGDRPKYATDIDYLLQKLNS